MKAARGAILAIHGLGGGPYELEPVIEALRQAGYEVLAPTLPGHEGGGRVMPASRWEQWADCVDRAYAELAERGPISVVGFSTGGTLALGLSVRRAVQRLAILAPFLAIRYTRWLPLRSATAVRWMLKVMPNVPRRGPPVRDPAMRAWVARQERYATFSLAATLSALELIDRIRPEVSKIEVPTLIIQGTKDSVVEPAEARWLHDRLGSARKRLRWMERSDHLVALDFDRAEVVREVLGWVGDRD
ncbi:MAG: carboxylesterase [Isosphaeraceae bacterium]|nr:MAG: carboxylesterase [Isosphaeraceae bacterium]